MSKEQCVDNWWHAYAATNALTHTKLPSNDQIEALLNDVITRMKRPNERLSPEGQNLLKELTDVAEKGRVLLRTKNRNEEIQNFISLANCSSGGDQSVQELKILGSLLITNSQFRKLLNELVLLARDMLAESPQPERRPSQVMDEIYEEPPTLDRPDFSRFLQHSANQDYMENDQQQQDSRPRRLSSYSSSKRKGSTGSNQSYMRRRLSREERSSFWNMFKQIMKQLQAVEDYQKGADCLLSLAESLSSNITTAGSQSTTGSTFTGSHNEKSQQSAAHYLKAFLENLNETPLDGLFEAVHELQTDANTDNELHRYFQDGRDFLKKCLHQKGFLDREEARGNFTRLQARAGHLFHERYSGSINEILDEAKYWGEQFHTDKQLSEFQQSVKNLLHSLSYNSEADSFRDHIFQDIFQVLMSQFVTRYAKFLPVARIEISDQNVDLVIDNLIIESTNLLPTVTSVVNRNHLQFFRHARGADIFTHEMTLRLFHIQMNLKDFSYYIRQKKGFPALKDVGKAEIYLGRGVEIEVTLAASNKDKSKLYHVQNIDVAIKDIDVKLIESRHKMLFLFAKPLLVGAIKKATSRAISEKMRQILDFGADEFSEMKSIIKRRQKEFKHQPEENTPSTTSLYLRALSDRLKYHRENPSQPKERQLKDVDLPGKSSDIAAYWESQAETGEGWRSEVFTLQKERMSEKL